MKLGRRLKAIFDEIENCNSVADIGTDHGLLVCKCILDKICSNAIASDISAKSLEKAIKNAEQLKIDHLIDFRVGNGLDVICANEVNYAVIAGMGGFEIISILKNANLRKMQNLQLILSPMQHHCQLREWLRENNFEFIHERIVEENGKFYFIFKVIICGVIYALNNTAINVQNDTVIDAQNNTIIDASNDTLRTISISHLGNKSNARNKTNDYESGKCACEDNSKNSKIQRDERAKGQLKIVQVNHQHDYEVAGIQHDSISKKYLETRLCFIDNMLKDNPKMEQNTKQKFQKELQYITKILQNWG